MLLRYADYSCMYGFLCSVQQAFHRIPYIHRRYRYQSENVGAVTSIYWRMWCVCTAQTERSKKQGGATKL
ncbi:uncharacterized protein YALI1_E05319g [Yarrowia lipolytica]|uniref:Uncharacterized protein n=1 Tax=Yarrowia lipolytica TaxID=4952 RepID=A0A1D8NH35_YARLL|nr:hypothetical protein YALI1_E05319g [Yarrowia lipolytica]